LAHLINRGVIVKGFVWKNYAATQNLKPILVHYIYHQNESGKLYEMDLPLLKNDITRFFLERTFMVSRRN